MYIGMADFSLQNRKRVINCICLQGGIFMEKDTFRYHAANGEHDILATLWEPRISEPRAVIQIAHGMAEHRKRYEEFANYMTERGLRGMCKRSRRPWRVRRRSTFVWVFWQGGGH